MEAGLKETKYKNWRKAEWRGKAPDSTFKYKETLRLQRLCGWYMLLGGHPSLQLSHPWLCNEAQTGSWLVAAGSHKNGEQWEKHWSSALEVTEIPSRSDSFLT